MTKLNQSELYTTQISFTEWFSRIGHKHADAMRQEDKDKRDRLEILQQVLSLPYDKPYKFLATDIKNQTENFKAFLAEHGHNLWGIRLIPLKEDLPIIRIRGLTGNEGIPWFHKQEITPEDYRVDFIPHGEIQRYSTIFVVHDEGVYGEIITGGHYQLTQGIYDQGSPIIFSYDFDKWQFSEKNVEIWQYVKTIIKRIKTKSAKVKKTLAEKLDASFTNDYLKGYFETVDTKEYGLWYVDYNRILGTFFKPYTQLRTTVGATIKGFCASNGKVTGTVRIISPDMLATTTLSDNEVLVCQMTTPDYLPAMKQAAAIVTDLGGILSHAAIISRELGKPCVVGTKNATLVLQDGDLVEVDAFSGTVSKI